jgi:hypothetical protein
MNAIQALRAFLMITLGYTQAQAESKVPDGTEDLTAIMGDLTNAHKAKVNALTEETLAQGYNKGKLESLTKFEEDVRLKFGVGSKKKGLELIDQIIAEKVPDPANPDSIPADAIKKHPVYLEREKDLNTQLTLAKTETEKKVKEVQDSYTAKEEFTKIAADARKKFRGMNPDLPANEEAAAKQEARFIKELEASGLVLQYREGQDPLILEKIEGGGTKRKEDEHGNPVKWEDVLRSTADSMGFVFKAGEERTAPGGNNPGTTPPPQPGQRKYTGKLPTTEAEYVAIITNDSIPRDQRFEVQDAWEAQNKTPTS